LNQTDFRALGLRYDQLPVYYIWENQKWRRRKNAVKALGRMPSISISKGEPYYLRLVILTVRAVISFADMKNGCNTWKERCIQLGLLHNDNIWKTTMDEVSMAGTPHQLRQTFCTLLLECAIKNPVELYDQFKDNMMADYLYIDVTRNESHSENKLLCDIQELLEERGKRNEDFDLPQPTTILSADERLNLHFQRLYQHVSSNSAYNKYSMASLTIPQRIIATAILTDVAASDHEPDVPRLHFLTGPGGTGKTHLINTILKHLLINQKQPVAACAWSGLAASHLINGNTVHKTFGLPFRFSAETRIPVSPISHKGMFLKSVKLIFLDEATLLPLDALLCLDALLRDLKNKPDIPFGGVTIVFSGDWRQCLPIVKRGTRAEVVSQCITRWQYWSKVEVHVLNHNLRADPQAVHFPNWLLDLGAGKLNGNFAQGHLYQSFVELEHQCCVQPDQLEEEIFGGMNSTNIKEYQDHVILAPLNDDVHKLNDAILEKYLPAEPTYTFWSCSTAEACVDEDDSLPLPGDMAFPPELLHELNPSGFPRHELTLKPGCIVILLRTISQQERLCNGTRLRVLAATNNAVLCETLKQPIQQHWICRVIFKQDQPSKQGFILRRRQFPLRLAFAMTIDKSQGSTFKKVGVQLKGPVFSHGQLYVASSRTTNFANLRFSITHNLRKANAPTRYYYKDNGQLQQITKNIVYPEILHHITRIEQQQASQMINSLENEEQLHPA